MKVSYACGISCNLTTSLIIILKVCKRLCTKSEWRHQRQVWSQSSKDIEALPSVQGKTCVLSNTAVSRYGWTRDWPSETDWIHDNLSSAVHAASERLFQKNRTSCACGVCWTWRRLRCLAFCSWQTQKGKENMQVCSFMITTLITIARWCRY